MLLIGLICLAAAFCLDVGMSGKQKNKENIKMRVVWKSVYSTEVKIGV